MSEQITLKLRIYDLCNFHGSLSNAARELGIDKGYLQRLFDGTKTNPSDEVLTKLGLRKQVVYFKN